MGLPLSEMGDVLLLQQSWRLQLPELGLSLVRIPGTLIPLHGAERATKTGLCSGVF